MIVAMCDGSSKGNPGPSTIGVIIWHRIKDHTRINNPTLRVNESVGIKTNNEAEWMALIKTIEIIVKKQWHEEEAYIYSDSQLVCSQVNGIRKVKNDSLAALFFQWNQLIYKIKKFQVVWVPRQLIQLADKEAARK